MENDCGDLEELAQLGMKVIGPSVETGRRHYRPGDMVFYGGLFATMLLRFDHLQFGWVIAIMLAGGWALNEIESRSIA